MYFSFFFLFLYPNHEWTHQCWANNRIQMLKPMILDPSINNLAQSDPKIKNLM